MSSVNAATLKSVTYGQSLNVRVGSQSIEEGF